MKRQKQCTGLVAGFFLLLFSLPVSGLWAQAKFATESAIKPGIGVVTEDEEGERGLSPNCGGIERWSVKVLTDYKADSVNFTPDTISVSKFDSLPAPPPNSNAPRMHPVEFQTYAIHCRVVAKRDETDADYHLQMYDGLLYGIAEIPDPACSEAAASKYAPQFIAARNFATQRMGAGSNYSVNIPRVIITGVGFVDPPHGQTGAAQNNMELHPVIDIRFENPADGIEEKYKLLDVTVGPNPFKTSTEFQINSKRNNLNKVTLSLFDILGEEVSTLAIPVISGSQIDYILEKNELKPGIYLYRFRNDGAIMYEGRLIVQ